MTVLRSREIPSSVGPNSSKSSAGENVVLDPETPSKISEFISPSSNISTPTCLGSPGQELGLGLRDIVSESGHARRRSARLAGKVVDAELTSGKRRKPDVENSENRALDLDLGSVGGATEFFTAEEEVEIGGSVARSGLKGTAIGGRGCKRKLSIEANLSSFESHEGGELVDKFMSLRSGKRVMIGLKEDNSGSDRLEKTRKSKESGFVGSGDHLSEPNLEEGMEKDENGPWKKNRFNQEQKGKGKIVAETLEPSDSLVSSGSESEDLIEVTKAKVNITTESGVRTQRRLSREEKGKAKVGINASSSIGINIAEPNIEIVQGSSISGAGDSSVANEALPDEQAQAREAFILPIMNMNNEDIVRHAERRERHRTFARQNASRFAHFPSEDELGPDRAPDGAGNSDLSQNPVEDWPGPFSTAMKIIMDRATYVWSDLSVKREALKINWIPKKQKSCNNVKQAPSLQDLCLMILSKNADAISSLDLVPDSLRHKISWFLCDSRVMNGKFLQLLVDGLPVEVRVKDCSWLTEELSSKILGGLDASKLTVFQFDQCGSCMPDYILHDTLARSPNWLPALTMISMKSAYRLTDVGLSLLASAAPCLKSIDISQSPLLTSEGICCLSNSLRSVLRELYLDNCHGIDAMLILPALIKLENLEVLSLAGIETVCDDFVSKLVTVSGCRMKELVLADCLELTDSSLEVIGSTCFELRTIDLSNLCKLTDASIAHLANGCRAIEMLKLCRNGFSDIAIASYLDVRGGSLKDLSLNHITRVSGHTALSISRNCINIRHLDLSWCRKLTDEALGLIVDSCSLLESLKLFGCSQITSVFVDGHSNEQVKLIGLKTPLIQHIDVPEFIQGPLRYSPISP